MPPALKKRAALVVLTSRSPMPRPAPPRPAPNASPPEQGDEQSQSCEAIQKFINHGLKVITIKNVLIIGKRSIKN